MTADTHDRQFVTVLHKRLLRIQKNVNDSRATLGGANVRRRDEEVQCFQEGLLTMRLLAATVVHQSYTYTLAVTAPYV
jgi:hypothetical protein